MSKRTLTLLALAVVAYLVLRKKSNRPAPVGVVVGDVYDVETIA